jgi:hypothetical protein
LEGNRYYELPPVNSMPSPGPWSGSQLIMAGGRTKRVVEYKVERDIADYTNGINRLPVQWTTCTSRIPPFHTDPLSRPAQSMVPDILTR